MLCLRDFELYSRWVLLKFAYTVRAVHAKKKVIGLHKALNRRQFKEYYGFSASPIKFNYARATARQPIRLTLNLFLKLRGKVFTPFRGWE